MIYYEYESLFKQDSVKRNIEIGVSKSQSLSITLTNSDIVNNSMSITDSLCSQTNLKFGSFEGAEFTFTTTRTDFPYKDSALGIRILPQGAEMSLELPFPFVVTEEKLSSDRKRKQIKAVDLVTFANQTDVSSWYNSLTFPMTLKQFRDSLFNNLLKIDGLHFQTGLIQTFTNLVNDSMTVEKTIAPSQLMYGEVLRAIGEVNGVFPHIVSYIYIQYLSLPKMSMGLYPADDLYPAEDLYPDEGGVFSGGNAIEIGENGNYINATFEDYYVKSIDKLQIRTSENDIGVVVGTGDNAYVVEDNFLLYGKGTAELTTIANNLFNQIKDIVYVPCNIEIKGNPCMQVGDAIRMKTKNGTIVSYIMQRTLSGSQFLRDKYIATGNEYYEEQNVGYHYDLKKLKGKSNTLTRTIEETRSELSSLETNVQNNYSTTTEMESAISQSASDVLSTVSATYTTQSTFNSTVSNLQDQIDDNIETFTGSAVPTLNNAPASSWTTDTEKDKHIGDLYMVNSSGGSYAGFYYRFEKNNNTYSWVLLKDSEVTKALQDSAQALQDVSNLSTDLSTNYYTKLQTDSEISQSADSIKSTVSSAVSKYDEESYSIDYYGYGAPTLLAQGNNGKYYLNQSNGYLYQSNNTAWSKVDELDLITDNLSSAITQTANDISAEVTRATTAEGTKVNTTDHNSANTFGWTMNTSGIDVKSNGSTVLKINSSGLEVNGKITSQSGQIANMTITSTGFTYGGSAGIKPSGSFGNNVMAIEGNAVELIDTTNSTPLSMFEGGYGSGKTYIRSNGDVEINAKTGIYIKYNGTTAFSVYSSGISAFKQLNCNSGLSVTGTKSREVKTQDYGDRLLYCYETPSPMFGDIGEGQIASDGKCYIQIDPTFAETIQTSQYQVFLQKYGQGECYVSERHATYFIVEGTADLSFGWEIKAKQYDFSQLRLEKDFGFADMTQTDYGTEGISHMIAVNKERSTQ